MRGWVVGPHWETGDPTANAGQKVCSVVTLDVTPTVFEILTHLARK